MARGRVRRSAEESRDVVIEAARLEFAAYGLYGATGETISARAGISHPYLLRLFGSKRELFLAVVDRFFDELIAAVRDVDGEGGEGSLAQAEAAIQRALDDRDGYLCLHQICGACTDDDVGAPIRRRFAELYRAVDRAGDGDEAEVRAVFAEIMLNAAVAALQLPRVSRREAWVRRLLG